MKTVYQVRGFIAFSEKDIFEEGCDYQLSKSMHSDERFTANSLQGLFDLLADEFKAERVDLSVPPADPTYIGNFIVDSCDEDGRLDLQVYQRRPFQIGKPSTATAEKWKAGKADLWLTCYSFIVKKVTTGFSLVDEMKGGAQ